MKQITRSMAVVIALSLLLLCNCGKPATTRSDAELLKFVEFFPTQIGTSWAYKIEVGDTTPLEYRETNWPEIHKGFRERRQLQSADKTTKAYSLQLRIIGSTVPEGRVPAQIVRELSVDEDGLRIFGGAKQVFWEIYPGVLFPVIELRIFDSSNGPVNVPVKGTGYQQKRMVFFAENEPLPAVVGHPSEKERMIYHGIETNVTGFEGTECLHIQREIAAFEGGSDELSQGRSDELSKGWTEDMWFAKKKGLVRLIQRIDGKTAMTWSLDKFSSDTK